MIIRATFLEDGVAFDPTSVVLADATNTYGVRRADTGALVIAANTAMVAGATGVYTYSWDAAVPSLTYEYVVTAVIEGATYRRSGSIVDRESEFTELSELDSQIRSRVGDVGDGFLHQTERRVFRDFCKATEIWEEVITVTTVADQDVYDLSLPDNTHLMRFIEATIDDVAQTVEILERGDEAITLYCTPGTSGDTLLVRVIVAPTMVCNEAPTWLINRYGDGIADGVVFFLKGMAGTAWRDNDGAKLSMLKHYESIRDARIECADRRGPVVRMKIPRIV